MHLQSNLVIVNYISTGSRVTQLIWKFFQAWWDNSCSKPLLREHLYYTVPPIPQETLMALDLDRDLFLPKCVVWVFHHKQMLASHWSTSFVQGRRQSALRLNALNPLPQQVIDYLQTERKKNCTCQVLIAIVEVWQIQQNRGHDRHWDHLHFEAFAEFQYSNILMHVWGHSLSILSLSTHMNAIENSQVVSSHPSTPHCSLSSSDTKPFSIYLNFN